ncbi:carbohydrate esterase family 8 protein [Amniculicola lignicola CBS 123094]|uniref:pectinesterase n=1 Tax=Amniculicola lignicola CBS 123094 TaxID=1392246 RepID=A0A6A5WBB6_9PLEO|nr:carbohydrate esterase family 8 protein [Amniculicola lignicola CBS 123094]
MRFFFVTALLGFAAAQSSDTACHSGQSCLDPTGIESLISSSPSPSFIAISSSPPIATSTATSSRPNTVITVAADGSGQFTSINDAVRAAQNSNIATVTILAGTYSEAVTVAGATTVTLVGATATSVSDWSQNQVTIANALAALTIGTSSSKGVTLKNINFLNTATTSTSTNAVVISLRGANIAFYGCSIVSPGATAISASYGLALFANSYIEGSDKIFYNYPSVYVYNSTIVPLSSAASIVYSKGATISGVFYNSSVVFDSSSIQQKSGYTNTGVFLAAPNNAGAVAIYRSCAMGSLIAPAGIHPSAATYASFYGEFQSTGIGSSSSVASSCSAAAVASGTLVVSKNPGPCEYGNVTFAINAIPNDSKPYTIEIGSGTYVEQLSITRKGKVTLVGATNFTSDYTQNQVRIEISYGVSTSAGQNELTPVIYSKKTSDTSGLAIYNIDFVNTYPQTPSTAALAADFYGANIGAYGCSFIGYQDTLLANKGTQVFSNCYIEGSVDFIWGFSTAYFHQCMIVSNTPGSCIAAQSRATVEAVGGYVFDSCMVTYSSTYGSSYGLSYLGRPYSQFSIAVYMNSYIDKHIKDAGWSVWQTGNPQTSGVMFGEFNNSGPGSWQASTQRATFATNLTVNQAAMYGLAALIGDTAWLDMTAYNKIPSYSLAGPSTTSPSSPSSTLSGSTATATTNAHPESGTIPPTNAVIVSIDGSHDVVFTNLTAALASLPQDTTNQTIFLYPGFYNEQIPAVNRPGAVRIIGYTSGNPGQSYKGNQVTITFSRGLSVSPQPIGHSNAETATFATASNRISLYNINMINTDNIDGLESSYVTLVASIYGNDIAFYACSFDGWQDTLLTGATSGYQYYESCYIGGAIDFIWGYSKAYFKGCTIGAKRKSSAMTAQSRASSTAIGGYIFDQCLFTTAPGATDDLTNTVYLGRPYSQYALVVIKNSYLDKTIHPSGWKIWSATDPRTDYITFAEYNNSGPSNWENNAAARLAYGNATLLTSDSYPLASVMDSTSWIDMTYWNSIVTPQPAVVITVPTNTTTSGNSTFDGTTPPTGALVVSKNPITGITTYNTIQGALDAASASSKVNATIFIYPGVYQEQLIVNKSGHTIFRGYSSATSDYSQNQVTIQFNHGVDTQATTGSNTDGATVYAKGNYFHAFNINFKNNNGTQQDIASLGFAVQSSKYAALFGCQIYGNQDTLSISGSLFTFKTYIEGNVDFIYGSGSAYFLDSTISPNEDGISITASKRTTNITSAGFVFDQCTLKPAPGKGPFTNVGLGRPWNSYARVAFVDCNFDYMISAAGWNPWSKSTPNTDGVMFGEYHNFGPGSNNCKRASFSQQLSDADVVQFQLGNFFASTAFIDFPYVDVQPFAPGIGSPQTCSLVSSSAGSTLASTASIVSLSSTILPVVTVTMTTTLKLTTSTLITAPDVTSTTVVKITQILSISGEDVLKTSTQKITTTISSTSPDATSTSTYVITSDVGLTITPDAVTRTSTIESTITSSGVTTKAAATSIVKGTTTISVTSTSTPKATTSTLSQGSTVLITSSITPKGASTTLKTTISIAPTSTKTSTVKARTPRAATAITTTITSTLTSFVKTSTATQPGTTTYFTQTSVGTTTTSLKGTTSTLTITSVAKTSIIAQAGSTIHITLTSTSKIGQTTTLKASTTTVLSTQFVTKTILSTITAPTTTISSLATTTRSQTVTAIQQLLIVTRSSDVTSTIKITLPVITTTIFVTSTLGAGVTSVTITAAPETKMVVMSITSTITSLATTTKKGASACTA